MDRDQQIVMLQKMVLDLARCVAGLVEALAESTDPATAKVLQRWQGQVAEQGLTMPALN